MCFNFTSPVDIDCARSSLCLARYCGHKCSTTHGVLKSHIFFNINILNTLIHVKVFIQKNYTKNKQKNVVLYSTVFCPNTGEYGAKKIPYSQWFYAVQSKKQHAKQILRLNNNIKRKAPSRLMVINKKSHTIKTEITTPRTIRTNEIVIN